MGGLILLTSFAEHVLTKKTKTRELKESRSIPREGELLTSSPAPRGLEVEEEEEDGEEEEQKEKDGEEEEEEEDEE